MSFQDELLRDGITDMAPLKMFNNTQKKHIIVYFIFHLCRKLAKVLFQTPIVVFLSS